MCGIFGVIGRGDAATWERCARTLSHRGPDGFSSYASADGGAYLAHCRLAIIDLSTDGLQPMCNEDGSLWLVFNGEIYNFAQLRVELEQAGHRFKSKTDSEVILHAYEQWGPKCLDRFVGMFAFAIWNQRDRTLFLARDRLGIKPLVYSCQGGEFAFASEPRALLARPNFRRSINYSAMFEFMQLSYFPGSETIWDGIQRLPAAHWMKVDARGTIVDRSEYWQLRHEPAKFTFDEAVSAVHSQLQRTVAGELVSDVPLGVFLSGGIDSSTVAAYAAQSSPRINSFCIGFSNWPGSEDQDALSVANHLGTTHHTDLITPPPPDELSRMFDAWDEPLGDMAILPTYRLCELARRNVTVALSGDGGDEVFGGYNWYRQVQGTPLSAFKWFVERFRRVLGIGREWPHGCADRYEYFQFLHCPSISMSDLRALFPQHQLSRSVVPGSMCKSLMRADLDRYKRWQYIDTKSYMVENNLLRVDRISMAHSLEVRVPLLDHRLVELAFNLPDEYHLNQLDMKRVLRETLRPQVPPSVVNKRKQGFSFPIEQFLSQPEMIRALRDGELIRSGILDSRAFESTIIERGGSNQGIRLWLLYTLEQWAKRWLLA